MALTKQDLESIAAMIVASQQAAAPAAVVTEAPKVAKVTAAKANAIVRKLDPIDVEADESHTFRVLAHTGTGALYSRGARVVPIVDGKSYRSFDVGTLTALQGDGVLASLIAAIGTVNKRALLADHAPTAEQREAAKAGASV